ncbi:hypothetical protein F2Q68_00004542 [Brassica cretica]|uniref:Uncharacterized protein n=2 Tax=Brassica cretica TaxID=69181 RepID=A0ABQ7C9T4_BRACR|nr:hypothetical protein F2Q68_00004542 [Brassica cretica]KAF3548483.1 hypothetical protein DY000_02006668 [Brassica cretica]
MGDQDKEKNMENPDVDQKVCDGPWLHQSERTVHVIAPWLWSVPKSHLIHLICFNSFLFSSLWLYTKGTSCQRSRVAKGWELPKGVSSQKVRDTKGYEHQKVQGPRGTNDQRSACPKWYLLMQVLSDPYGSVYDLLSQDKYTVCLGQGLRPDQVRISVRPSSQTSLAGQS